MGVMLIYGHQQCDWSVTLRDPRNLEAMLAWTAKEIGFKGSCAQLIEVLKDMGTYPVSSADWWRLRPPVEHIDFASADQGADWHCAPCVGKWKWATEGATRLLVFGQSAAKGTVDLDQDGRAFCIYIGAITPEQENLFKLLQANVLACQLDEAGLPVTKDSVLQAIRVLNDRSKHRFGKDERVVTLRAADVRVHSRFMWHTPVCQNTALSMEASGQSLLLSLIHI